MSNKERFFARMAEEFLTLAFRDVRLKTAYSNVAPTEAKTSTRFSRNIGLKIPIASAAMDSVTEAEMGIAMGLAGGIGIIHRNMPLEAQVSMVNKVKLYLNGCIHKPICFRESDTMESVRDRIAQKGYTFGTYPVIDQNGKLVGLLTRNDFRFCNDLRLTVSAVMTPFNKVLTALPDTSLIGAHEIMRVNKDKVLLLLNSDGSIAGMYVYTDVDRIITNSHESYNVDSAGHLRVGAAIGTSNEDIIRAQALAEKSIDALVIDTAHGDSSKVYETLKILKKELGDKVDIVVGNVSQGDSAERLAEAGADAIKVGQGPGSICTTRIIAGVGRPQVSAIYSCSEAVRRFNIPIIADGGISYSGDITIAIGAGADSVMMGGLLAGTDEAPGEIITINGVPSKRYRGMGSLGAMKESQASRSRYSQPETRGNQALDTKLVPEGIEGTVPYRGPVSAILFQHVGGLRSGMGYIGASTIAELQSKAEFERITASGFEESTPHGIDNIVDAPNYTKGR